MLPSIECATLLQYFPKGQSDLAMQAKKLMADIKNGRIGRYKDRVGEIAASSPELSRFLHPNCTLVPMPRSSPIREGDLWPAYEIAAQLASLDLGSIMTCLKRRTAVRKMALIPKADLRPSIAEHYDSFVVENAMPTADITLVDDVLTQGRTAIAAASRLAEKFPNASIRVFALTQTRGKSTDLEIDTILNVQVGKIFYNHNTGKCLHGQ